MKVKPNEERTAAAGKLMQLLDAGSFMETGERVSARFTEFYQPDSVTESDGVVTGYGTIGGKIVFVFAQDGEVMGGTFGEQHGRKIADLYEHALKAKAPVIGLYDCSGFRVEEGLDGLGQFARLYKKQSEASGRIPQIAAVIGKCGGGMSIAAELADFVFIEKDKGSIFVNPQAVVSGSGANAAAACGGKYEWDEIADKIRKLVELLPSSADFYPEIADVDVASLNRSCDAIAGAKGDAKAMLADLADDGEVLELRADAGKDMLTGFVRIGGQPVGFAACDPSEGEKRISAAGCDKAAALVEFCDKFGIPVLTVTDTEGYQTTAENENYLPAAAGRLIRALAAADVPKINLITGKVVGTAYSMLNSKGLGADYVFMWEDADVSIVDARQATEIIYGEWNNELEQKYRDIHSSALALARHGLADKVIAPEDTRKYVIGALQTFVNSR